MTPQVWSNDSCAYQLVGVGGSSHLLNCAELLCSRQHACLACPHGLKFLAAPLHPLLTVVTGELALAAPALGISQRLLNKDHRAAYYEGMPAIPGARWAQGAGTWYTVAWVSKIGQI